MRHSASMSLNHCGMKGAALILTVWFPNSLYRIVAWALAVKYFHMNSTELHWTVNIGSVYGLLSLDNRPLPKLVLTQIYVAKSNGITRPLYKASLFSEYSW